MSVIRDTLREDEGEYQMMRLDKIRTAIHAGDYTPADPEWHGLRAEGITGTDVGAIMGVSPFTSAFKLWAIKTGQIDGHVEQNRAMRLGQLIEPALLQVFKEEHPEMMVHGDIGTYRHEDHPELIANPDGLATEGDKLWIIEIKTARQYWETVPEHYIRQCFHYADVFNADGIKLVSYAGGHYTEWEIPFTKDDLMQQRTAVLSFYEQFIQTKTAPEWDGSDSTYETVRAIAKPGDPEVTVELGYLGVQLSNANKKFIKAKKELTQLKSAALAQMDEGKFGVVSDSGEPIVVAVKRQRGDGNPWLEIK